MENIDVIIVGGGPAGLAAAVELYKKGVKDILVLERESSLGGILRQCIHDGFGLTRFKTTLSGPEYAQRFIDEIVREHIPYQTDAAVLEITKDTVCLLYTSPSYLVKAGDVIEVKEKAKASQRYKDVLEVTAGRLVPAWLDVDQENLRGTVPVSYTHLIADILVKEGYVQKYDIVDDGAFKTIRITLKYGADKNEKIISGIKRISKPGLRVYANKEDMPKVLGGLGTAIISTNQGVITDKEARQLGVGGEVLAFVW